MRMKLKMSRYKWRKETKSLNNSKVNKNTVNLINLNRNPREKIYNSLKMSHLRQKPRKLRKKRQAK